MMRIIEAAWEFHCPECGFGHRELGQRARDHEIFCLVCEHETGVLVRLDRWLSDIPDPPRQDPADLNG